MTCMTSFCFWRIIWFFPDSLKPSHMLCIPLTFKTESYALNFPNLFFPTEWTVSFLIPGTYKTSVGTVHLGMVQTWKQAQCEQWCNRLKTFQSLPCSKQWLTGPINCAQSGRLEDRMKGDTGNKTSGTSLQYGLWLTAGTGGANLRQQESRCRCQISGPGSLLLSSHWSLCAVKCHSKESDMAAPYAHWRFHPNLLPFLWLESSPNIQHKNTQLDDAYSIPADSTCSFIIVFSFHSHLCLLSHNTQTTLHSALDIS